MGLASFFLTLLADRLVSIIVLTANAGTGHGLAFTASGMLFSKSFGAVFADYLAKFVVITLHITLHLCMEFNLYDQLGGMQS